MRLYGVIASTVLILLGLASCGSKTSTETSNSENDTVYNDIQNTFFETQFGDSKEELENNISNYNLVRDFETCTDSYMLFTPFLSDFFSFGNLEWNFLEARFFDKKFCAIRFLKAFDEKDEALSYYETVLSKLSAKYKMYKKTPTDSNIYELYIGYGKKNRLVKVLCLQYETNEDEFKQGVALVYWDNNFVKKVSDEL